MVTRSHVASVRSFATLQSLQGGASLNPTASKIAILSCSIPEESRAEREFVKFHQSGLLSPGKFVLSEEHHWSRAFLPFWVFQGTFKYSYSYKLGRKNAQGKVSQWETMPWAEWQSFKVMETDENMQICGSFRYRHDFIQKLKPGGSIVEGGSQSKLAPGSAVGVDLQRGLAWDFAMRSVLKKQEEEIHNHLEQQHRDCSVEGLKIRLSGLPHRSELVYLPVYIINYIYGEKINVHGERIPNKFYAMVSATEGTVASTTHVSVKKAALMGGVTSAASMILASTAGYNGSLGWSLFDYLFISAGAAATCGLLAQVLPETRKQHEEYEVMSRFEDDLDYSSTINSNLEDLIDREKERILKEWTRWEQGSKDPCDPEKRQKWAESIWNSHRNRLQMIKKIAKERIEIERKKQADYEREMRREARWGPRQRRTLNEEFSKPKRNLDYLGFYEVLGLDPTDFVTQHDIKQHFYKRVIRYHPDKHKESKDKIEAKKLFQQLIRAYEVLKHPDTRKEYDAGDYKE